MSSMNKSFIREQIEILHRHMERETFDAAFVERHARFVADLARLEGDILASLRPRHGTTGFSDGPMRERVAVAA